MADPITIASIVVGILGIVATIAVVIPGVRQWLMNILLSDPTSMENTVPTSDRLVITEPANGTVFRTRPSQSTLLITVAGKLSPSEVKDGRKLLVVIHTDKDYPQSMFEPPSTGIWQVTRNRLGGVDHRVFAI